jgi:hypothetical protein
MRPLIALTDLQQGIHHFLSYLFNHYTYNNSNNTVQWCHNVFLVHTICTRERLFLLLLIFFPDMYEIVSDNEEDNDRLEFTLSYHFASTLRSATSNGEMGSPARARRLAQEITSLSTSLPLSSSSSVFVRCDETRLDIMKVQIGIMIFVVVVGC